jgi:hypothetical protein
LSDGRGVIITSIIPVYAIDDASQVHNGGRVRQLLKGSFVRHLFGGSERGGAPNADYSGWLTLPKTTQLDSDWEILPHTYFSTITIM